MLNDEVFVSWCSAAFGSKAAQCGLQAQGNTGLLFLCHYCYVYWFYALVLLIWCIIAQANVRQYYQQFEEQQTQSLLDQKIKEHLGQTAAYGQVGAAYNQHLMARPRMPILPNPMMQQMPGGPPMAPGGIRIPVLPRPPMGAPGNVGCFSVIFFKKKLCEHAFCGESTFSSLCCFTKPMPFIVLAYFYPSL